MTGRHLALAALVLAPVTACVGPVDTRIDSMGGPVPPASFRMTALRDGASAQEAEAHAAVQRALEKAGFTAADNGPLLVDIGIADRPGAVGVTIGDGDDRIRQEAAQNLKTAAFRHPCSRQDYRLTLAITDIANGRTLYRGTTGEAHCNRSLGQALPYLAEAAVEDIRAGSSGSRQISRMR